MQLKPFGIDSPGPGDIVYCCCVPCYNRDWTIEFLCDYFASDITDEELDSAVQDLPESTEPFVLKQMIVEKSKVNNKIVYNHTQKMLELSRSEFIQRYSDNKEIYEAHKIKLDHHNQFWKLLKKEKLENGWVLINDDFSANVPVRSKHMSQDDFLGFTSYLLLCSIVEFYIPKDQGFHKYKKYVYHNGYEAGHDGQIVLASYNSIINNVIELASTKNHEIKGVLLLSDNCAQQFKCRHTIFGLVSLSYKYNLPILKTYGVAGHGKSEVDSCGGAAFKNIITRAIEQGEHLRNPDQYVNYLKSKDAGVYKDFYILSSDNYKKLYDLKNDTPQGASGAIDNISKQQRFLIDASNIVKKNNEYRLKIFSSDVMNIDEMTTEQEIKIPTVFMSKTRYDYTESYFTNYDHVTCKDFENPKI